MATISELFHSLAGLVPLKVSPNNIVIGTGCTSASQPDLELAEINPAHALRTIVKLPDVNTELHNYFDSTCARRPTTTPNFIPTSYHWATQRVEKGLASETDILDVIKHLATIVVDSTRMAIEDDDHFFQYHNPNSSANGKAYNPDLILQARRHSDGNDTDLISIETKFGHEHPRTNTLLDNLAALLEGRSAIRFPTYREQFDKAITARSESGPAHIDPIQPDGELFKTFLSLSIPDHVDAVDFSKAEWSLVHQVWTRMVARDLTFSAVTDYRMSFFAIRERKSQTLYLSVPVVITVTDNNPTSLLAPWTALLCLAHHDSAEREEAKNKKPPTTTEQAPGHPNPDYKHSREPDEDDRDDQDQHRRKRAKQMDEHSSHSPSPSPTRMSGLQLVYRLGQEGCEAGLKHRLANNLGRLPVTLTIPSRLGLIFRTGLLSSEYSTTLTKLLPIPARPNTPLLSSGSSREQTNTAESNSSNDGAASTLKGYDPNVGTPNLLVLLSLIGEGLSARVWGGYIDLGIPGSVGIVAKTGLFEETEHETNMYLRLEERLVLGVPKLLGLYRAPSSSEKASFGFLMLSDEGGPVTDDGLSDEECTTFIFIIDQIHKAGILHHDLRGPNLLRKKTSGGHTLLAIVDFHLAEIDDSEEAASRQQREKKEFKQLLEKLTNEP